MTTYIQEIGFVFIIPSNRLKEYDAEYICYDTASKMSVYYSEKKGFIAHFGRGTR